MKLDTSKPIKSVNLNGTDAPLDILNIAYGTTPPADVTRLWVPLEQKPDNVEINGDSLQNAIELIETKVSKMPTALVDYATATVNGKVYIFGGYSGKEESAIYEYDPATDTFTHKTAAFTNGLRNACAVAINGKAYIFGGREKSQTKNNDTIYEYDPLTDNLATKSAKLYATLQNGVAVAINGKAYIFGGYTPEAIAYIQEYDIVADRCTLVNNFDPDNRVYSASAVAINGKAYIFGGNNGSSALNQIVEYDPASNAVTVKGAKLKAQMQETCAVAINGKAYIFGGSSSSVTAPTSYTYIQEYDPFTDTLVVKDVALSQKRHGAGAGEVDGSAYIFSGWTESTTGDKYYDLVEAYTPKAYLGANHLKVFASVYRGEEYQLVTNIVNNKNAQVKLYMTSAFIGDEDGYAKAQDAYVFNKEKQQWQALDGTSMTTDMLNALAELGVT